MIPKIIHQTYKNNNLPELFQFSQFIIKKLHPDFEYKFYTDKDMYYFIKNEFSQYYNAFKQLPKKIMQIDMFRYFLMYKYGGIYADMDYRFFKKFDLLNYKVVIPISMNKPACLSNCIFASEPAHPFWKTLMDTLFTIDRTIQYKSKNDIFNSTGPKFVYKMWKRFKNKNEIYCPERFLFHPQFKNNINILKKTSYGVHLCTGTWLKNNY